MRSQLLLASGAQAVFSEQTACHQPTLSFICFAICDVSVGN